MTSMAPTAMRAHRVRATAYVTMALLVMALVSVTLALPLPLAQFACLDTLARRVLHAQIVGLMVVVTMVLGGLGIVRAMQVGLEAYVMHVWQTTTALLVLLALLAEPMAPVTPPSVAMVLAFVMKVQLERRASPVLLTIMVPVALHVPVVQTALVMTGPVEAALASAMLGGLERYVMLALQDTMAPDARSVQTAVTTALVLTAWKAAALALVMQVGQAITAQPAKHRTTALRVLPVRAAGPMVTVLMGLAAMERASVMKGGQAQLATRVRKGTTAAPASLVALASTMLYAWMGCSAMVLVYAIPAGKVRFAMCQAHHLLFLPLPLY
mmetsp:Transcript_26567/g.68212  ORF Transcript_26567/g.68212 Transcript_26567/m.68212 type:complete len:326 (-) Transcript_26567:585-1562(-)